MKDIKIKPANNGWIIEIGCQTFVAESKTKMLSEIGRYIDDPEAVEKEYMKNPKNKPEGGQWHVYVGSPFSPPQPESTEDNE